MSVADTRAKIIIDTKSAQRALENLTRSMGAFEKSLYGTKTQFNGISSGITKINSDVMTLTKSITIAEGALQSLNKFNGMIGRVFKGAYDYSTNLESNAVGISGILTSMTKINGKQLEWNQALSVSKDIMKELRTTALQTASTAPELIDTFRAILGPAMGAGMNVNQVMKLTTVGVNSVKSMGLKDDQLVQELRSIIQGNIRPASSTLATALGISNADVKKAIASSDGLFKFLMDKLKGFEMSVGETSKTIKGRVDILNEALYQSIEKGGTEAFESIRNALKDLSDRILVFNSEAKRFELNPKFVEQIEKVSGFVKELIDDASYIGNKLLGNMSGITNAFVFFAKAETYIGIGGLLIAGVSKFTSMFQEAGVYANKVASFVSMIKGNQERVAELETRIAESLKEQKNVTKDIDDYNKNILKSIESEARAQDKLAKKAEDYVKLFKSNQAGFNRLVASKSTKQMDDIFEMRTIGATKGIDKNFVENFINDYIRAYEKYGAKHAEAYMKAFKDGIRQYSISDDIKALMQKGNASLSSNDFFKLAEARNKAISNNVGFKQEDINRLSGMDKAFQGLLKTMEKSGQTSNVLTEHWAEFNKQVLAAGGDISKVQLKISEQDIKQMEHDLRMIDIKQNVIGSLNAIGGILTGLGFIYKATTDDSDSLLGSFAEYAITAGTVVTAISQIGSSYTQLMETIKALIPKEALLKLIQSGVLTPTILSSLAGVGIGATVAAGTVGVYAWANDLSMDEIKRRFKSAWVGNEGGWVEKERRKEEYEKANQSRWGEGDDFEYVDLDTINKGINLNDLEINSGGGGEDEKAANKAKRLQERLDEARRQFSELRDSIIAVNAGLDTNLDQFAKKQAEITKKSGVWTDKLEKLKGKGNFKETEIKEIETLISNYEKLAKAENERNKKKQEYANALQNVKNLQDTNELSNYEANKKRASILNEEIAYLQSLLPLYAKNADDRLKIETDLAAKKKALREAEATDMKIHWDDVLNHIKNTTFDQTSVVKSTFDNLLSTFTNFGQNMLIENKSISERAKDLFKDFANSIWNMMMKLIMQGLAMKMILGLGNMFGGGGGNTLTTSGGATRTSFGLGAKTDLSSISLAGRTFAKGGVAEGWSIVGEKGPELVNFSSPGRVYTAEQTRNALSGGNGNLNVVINLKNESGQQIEAQQTGSGFDGENYVVGVVLRAISTNRNGMRNIIQGVARA